MSESREEHRYRLGSVYFAYAFFGLLALFMLNVLLGKASLYFGWKLSFLLGDVGEYLLLFAIAGLFAVTTLLREALKGVR